MSGRKLRVLHCIPTLGGGGAERQLSHIAGGLAKTGVEVHVAYHKSGPNLDYLRKSGTALHELRSSHNYDPRLFWQLVQTIRQVKPDVIHTWIPQMDILGGLAAMFTGTPFFLSEQCSAMLYGGTWKDRLRTWVGSRARRIVANSETGKEYWVSYKEPTLIAVIPNGVALELIKESPATPCDALGIDPQVEVILFAGRYDPQKNVLALLEGLRRLLSERPNAVALLFGQGPLEVELLEAVKRYGITDRLKVRGYTTELWSWMKRANVFVSVSLFEGSPNTMFEAAVLKCPLVLSNIREHREFMTDESAFFVSPDEPVDIARGILEVLRDPTGAKRKADSAYERLSCFSVEAVTTQYVELYKSVLARPSSGKSGDYTRQARAKWFS